MNGFWFLAGVLTTLAIVFVLRPGRQIAAWKIATVVGAMVLGVLLLYLWLGHREQTITSSASAIATPTTTSTLTSSSGPNKKADAGSMNTAIASLEARLAKGGGGSDDWELLAKSYEFLGRPEDAKKARARQLPPVPQEENSSMDTLASAPLAAAIRIPTSSTNAAGTNTISGEVSLASTLSGKAAAGATLFIVAKSVDVPGPPVAVIRSTVGTWPVKFTLDDSQSMVPGRNISSAARVKVEARISQSGQASPSAGDLQGSSEIIKPTDHPVIKIIIDKIVN